MYEVYALKYGERDTTACQFFYRESSHAPITLHYFVWLILGGPTLSSWTRAFSTTMPRPAASGTTFTPPPRSSAPASSPPTCRYPHHPSHYDHWAVTASSRAPSSGSAGGGGVLDGALRVDAGLPGSANVNALAGLVTLNYGNRIRIVDGDQDVLPGFASIAWAVTPRGCRS